MLATRSYSLDGRLGALAVIDTASQAIVGLALFGRGFDGRDLVLECQPSTSPGASHGAFDVFRGLASASSEWPVKEGTKAPAGIVRAALEPDGTGLVIVYSLDKLALSPPAVEFSPPLPDRVVGTQLLGLLA